MWGKVRMKKENIKKIIFGFCLLAVTILLFVFLDKKVDCLLNSDEASELIFARILANNNSFFTNTWYYSTEIRAVGIHLVYMLLFKLVSNWHVVRIASGFILCGLMLLSYVFYCKKINLKKCLLLALAVFMIPFSEQYFSFVLVGNMYIPYIICSFIVLGLMESNSEKMKKGKLFLIFLISLAFSLNGIRQLIVFHLPILLVAVLLFIKYIVCAKEIKVSNVLEEGSFKYLVGAVVSAVGAFIGYVINTAVLSKLYQFQNWNDIAFTYFDIQKVNLMFNHLLESYGWRAGDVFSTSLISNVSCGIFILMTIISIVYALKNFDKISDGYKHLVWFYLSAIVVLLGLYSCTNLYIVARYNLPIVVFSVPLIFVFVNEVEFANNDIMKYKDVILYVFAFVVLLSGLCVYNYFRYEDRTFENRKIVEVLEEGEYYSGYATFWQGNVLTELSNGDIDVWVWCDSGDNGEQIKYVTDINQTFNWLQKTSHTDSHPDGKVFVLLSRDELSNCNWREKLEDCDNVIYESDFYVIYGFESYDEMISVVDSI